MLGYLDNVLEPQIQQEGKGKTPQPPAIKNKIFISCPASNTYSSNLELVPFPMSYHKIKWKKLSSDNDDSSTLKNKVSKYHCTNVNHRRNIY